MSGVHAGQVGWREVEHWMWPLFAPRWTNWRQSRLGLPPVMSSCCRSPSYKDNDVQTQSKKQCVRTAQVSQPTKETSPESSGGSACTEAAKQTNVSSIPALSLPSPVPLLYGLSPQVIQQPGYWPDSIRVCGFWQHKSRHEEVIQMLVSGTSASLCMAVSSNTASEVRRSGGQAQQRHPQLHSQLHVCLTLDSTSAIVTV